MNSLIKLLSKTSLLKGDLDNHLVCASMVIIYFFFGYQKSDLQRYRKSSKRWIPRLWVRGVVVGIKEREGERAE